MVSEFFTNNEVAFWIKGVKLENDVPYFRMLYTNTPYQKMTGISAESYLLKQDSAVWELGHAREYLINDLYCFNNQIPLIKIEEEFLVIKWPVFYKGKVAAVAGFATLEDNLGSA